MLHARTIREAAEYFRAEDPQTCLTETAIRTLLRTGAVPCVRVGKKYLVTLEVLEDYLMTGMGGSTQTPQLKPSKVWQIH